MPKSRRVYDDDDDERSEDDEDRRPRRRSRKQEKPFPLVLVLVLIFTPVLLIGGYFGIKAIRKSSERASVEQEKVTRSKIIGDWVLDEGGGKRMELKIRDDDRITMNISLPNAGRSITTTYHVVEATRDTITIRLAESVEDGGPVDIKIEIVSEQQLKVAISTNKSPPQIFKKQAATSKPKK